ncbi:MAG: hypothetical protein HY203_04330 [Nitrospirae bacterium]|nr:hypothetical protein [Nitrospirota bacterium]
MFFARVRWIGRVLDGAGIDTSSKTGRELSTTIISFSKYCQEKNRRGDGTNGMRLDLGPAEWALLAAILAPEESKITAQLSAALGLSHTDASALVTRTRESALKLAEQKMPALLATIAGK